MAVSRREFLKLSGSSMIFVIGSQIFFGKKVSADSMRRFADFELINLIKEMPTFDGVFSVETNVLNSFADDFGHHIHQMPLGVLKPANSQDIQKMASFCFQKKIKLTMRGTGGSTYGQTQLHEGIIIDSSSLKGLYWLSEDLIQLEPGTTWREVLDFTIQSQRAPIVMPDALHLTVGGSASVGGVGESSFSSGAIVDQIVEFDLVTIQGELLTCNEQSNYDLFQVALASMGQFGFITKVVLKTMMVPEKVYLRQFKYEGLDFRYLSDTKFVAESETNAAIVGHLVRTTDPKIFNYVLDIAHWGEAEPSWVETMSVGQAGETKQVSYFDYCHRNTKAWEKSLSQGLTSLPHPYFSFFLPYERCEQMTEILQKTDSANLGAGKMAIMPLLSRNLHRPLFKFGAQQIVMHFRIYRSVQAGESGAEHLVMLKANQDLLAKVFEMSGKAYLPWSPLLSEEQRPLQFESSNWQTMQLFKQKIDSEKLLNSGAGLF